MNHAKKMGIRIATLLLAAGVGSASALIGCGSEIESGGTTAASGGSGGGNGSSSSGNGSGGSAGGPTCPSGNASVRQCYTLEQIANAINFPPGVPIDPDAGPPDGGYVMFTECPAPSVAQDGCCNPGVAGPEIEGDTCCYYFCDGPCCGRAFTIEGHARVANVIERDDWCGSWSSETNVLDDVSRKALVEAWCADAQMEHASVASFARFTLELLGLGAPADIVAASQSASLDEIEHARLCFALASRFSGQSLGPGPMDMQGALRGTSLAEIAGWAVVEGCIGETIAALTARAQLDGAQDEDTRRALLRIAEDEEAHAALAWRFVAWALSMGGAPVRAAITQAFDEGARQIRAHRNAEVPGVDTATWRHFGRLTGAEMDRIAMAALDEAIMPNARLLLGNTPQAASSGPESKSESNTPAYT